MEIYILIFIVLAFATIVAATLGFGDALIFTSIVALFIDVRTAIVLMGFWSIWVFTINAIKYRKFIDKVFVKKNVPPGIIGAILGSLLIVIAPLRWIELFLGIFVMVFVLAKFLEMEKQKHLLQDPNENLRKLNKDINSLSNPVFYTGAFSYGFLSGLIGASGPINVVLLERTGHEKECFIANFAICSVIVSAFKLGIYLGSGLFPVDYLLVYIIGFAVIIVSTKIGHSITPRISKKKFEFCILLLLTLIGIRLIVNSLFFY